MRSVLISIMILGISSLGGTARGQARARPRDLQATRASTVLIEVIQPGTTSRGKTPIVSRRASGLVARVNGDEVAVLTALSVVKPQASSTPERAESLPMFVVFG